MTSSPGLTFFIKQDKTATKSFGLKLLISGNTDDFSIHPANSHVRCTGKNSTEPLAGFRGDKTLPSAAILRGSKPAKGRVYLSQLFCSSAACANKILTEGGIVIIPGQGKGPGVIEKWPWSDILMRKRQDSTRPEGIPGGQTTGQNTFVTASLKDHGPEGDQTLYRDKKFKSELSGIPCP